MKQYLVLIPISTDRNKLDLISELTFNSKEDILKELCFDEDNPIAVEDVLFTTKDEMVELCNNNVIDFVSYWLAWVWVKDSEDDEPKKELKHFEVKAYAKTSAHIIIKAEDVEDAMSIADDIDGGLFTVEDEVGEWQVFDAKEVELEE